MTMKHFIYACGVLLWMAGLVLAKGFWSALFALAIPPWAWYLVVERAMQLLKIV